jgi:hypothetical protein
VNASCPPQVKMPMEEKIYAAYKPIKANIILEFGNLNFLLRKKNWKKTLA